MVKVRGKNVPPAARCATLKAGLRMRIGCRNSGLKCVRIRVECKGAHNASQVRVL